MRSTHYSLQHSAGFITITKFAHVWRYVGDDTETLSHDVESVETFPIQDLPAFMLANNITEFHTHDDCMFAMHMDQQQIAIG